MTFFFTIAFMILVFWRPQDWLVPWLYGWPVLDVIFFGAVLSFLIELDQKRLRFPSDSVPVYLLAGFWFSTLMSHFANTYFQGFLDTLVVSYKFSVFGMLMISVLDRPSRLRWVVRIIVAMACLMAVHAMMQYYSGAGFMGRGPFLMPATGGRPETLRTYFFGIFEDPNDLAQILITAIPFALLLTRRIGLFGLTAAAALIVLLVWATMTTHSRGGYVALGVVGLLLFLLLLPSRWLPTVFVPSVAGALAVCPYAGAFLDQSARERIVFWGLANWKFKAHPVFGIGYDMFWQVAQDRAAHNAFVECYTTIGFFGYWFWFGLLAAGVWGAWKTNVALRGVKGEDARWLKRFSSLSIVAVAGYAAAAYFLSRAFVFPLFFLTGMMAAVPIIAKRILGVSLASIVGTPRQIAILCTIGAVVSILYIYFSILLLNKAVGG